MPVMQLLFSFTSTTVTAASFSATRPNSTVDTTSTIASIKTATTTNNDNTASAFTTNNNNGILNLLSCQG